jgi:hypothetical protein
VGMVYLNNLCWCGGVQKWAVKCFTLWAVQINYSPINGWTESKYRIVFHRQYRRVDFVPTWARFIFRK